MIEKPLVSIILPTYNRALQLKKAIDSVFMQSYENWELLIIDNFSEDNSLDVINTFDQSKVSVLQIKNNGIIGKSRNVGITNAKGKYIAFLDSDDLWESCKLEKTIEILIREKVDFIYHNCLIKKKNSSKPSRCRKLNNNAYDDLILNGNTIVTSSVVLSKNIFKNLKFSEENNFIGWEDYDLWIKIAMKNYKFRFIPEILGSYNVGNDNFDNPKRVLHNIEQINTIILQPYIKEKKVNKIWWPNYTRGLAFLALNKKRKSIIYFFRVIFQYSPILSKIKSIYLIIFSSFLGINF